MLQRKNMKVISLVLASLLVCEGASSASQAKPTTETLQAPTQKTPEAAKIKAKVQKRGTGEKSQVKVRLVNGAEVKGYVSKIEESSFTVTEKKTGQTTTVSYADVRKIQGRGLSKGGMIALVVVGVAVAVFVAFGVALSHAD